MSDPIPVTTRIITADSGSSRSVKPAVKSPDEIQVNTRPTIARESGGSATSRHTASSDTANEPAIAPHAMAPAAALLTRRPKPAFTRKPRSGRSGINSSITKMQPRKHEARKKDTKKTKGFLRARERRLNAETAEPAQKDVLCELCALRGETWARSPFQRRERIGVQ